MGLHLQSCKHFFKGRRHDVLAHTCGEMVRDAFPAEVAVKREPHLVELGGYSLDPSSRGDIAAIGYDGCRHLCIDVTLRTPSMVWADTEAFLTEAEQQKEKRYYQWLESIKGQVDVFYASASVHGRLGPGMHHLVSFCAKQRAGWAGALEQQSLRATFKWAWTSRIALSTARAAFSHAQQALVKLIPDWKTPNEHKTRKGMDPLLNAGVFPLREAPPTPWRDDGPLCWV